MTEKSYPPRPETIPDNPIAKAALAIRELHEQAIDNIDGGEILLKDFVDVSDQVKRACIEEIRMCDAIIAKSTTISKDVMSRGATLHLQVVEEIGRATGGVKEQDTVRPDDVPILHVGEHKAGEHKT